MPTCEQNDRKKWLVEDVLFCQAPILGATLWTDGFFSATGFLRLQRRQTVLGTRHPTTPLRWCPPWRPRTTCDERPAEATWTQDRRGRPPPVPWSTGPCQPATGRKTSHPSAADVSFYSSRDSWHPWQALSWRRRPHSGKRPSAVLDTPRPCCRTPGVTKLHSLQAVWWPALLTSSNAASATSTHSAVGSFSVRWHWLSRPAPHSWRSNKPARQDVGRTLHLLSCQSHSFRMCLWPLSINFPGLSPTIRRPTRCSRVCCFGQRAQLSPGSEHPRSRMVSGYHRFYRTVLLCLCGHRLEVYPCTCSVARRRVRTNGWPGKTMPAEVSCPPSHCAEPNGDSRYRNRSCCQLPSTHLRLCRSAVRTATHACQLSPFSFCRESSNYVRWRPWQRFRVSSWCSFIRWTASADLEERSEASGPLLDDLAEGVSAESSGASSFFCHEWSCCYSLTPKRRWCRLAYGHPSTWSLEAGCNSGTSDQLRWGSPLCCGAHQHRRSRISTLEQAGATWAWLHASGRQTCSIRRASASAGAESSSQTTTTRRRCRFGPHHRQFQLRQWHWHSLLSLVLLLNDFLSF